jgi:hypothetical protein
LFGAFSFFCDEIWKLTRDAALLLGVVVQRVAPRDFYRLESPSASELGWTQAPRWGACGESKWSDITDGSTVQKGAS